jgi:hypothetical protein
VAGTALSEQELAGAYEEHCDHKDAQHDREEDNVSHAGIGSALPVLASPA